MSRPHPHRRRPEVDHPDTSDLRWEHWRPPFWSMPRFLLVLLIGGLLLLWAVRAGYGLWVLAGVILVVSLPLGIWTISAVRVALAWGRHRPLLFALRIEERTLGVKAAKTALEAEQAESEAVRRRSRAEHLRAQALYLKASAEASRLQMSVVQDQAALRAGLHYPGQHGYPVHVTIDPTGRPRIRATDYRALPRPTGEQPALASPGTGAAPTLVGSLPLPGPLRDLDVLRGWDFRADNVYLATGRGGQPLTCSLEGWHHIAHDARTGGGKTLLARLELAMMLTLGIDLVLCNPHFAPIDRRGHDWRPLGFHLERLGPVELAPGVRVARIQRKTPAIRDLLRYLAKSELDRRYELQAQGIFDWTPLYVFVDEVPWLTKQHPEIAGFLIAILQRGRAVDVRLLTNAQSFLVDNTGLGAGSRDNFGTAYFLGGNPKSGAAMLGVAERDLKLLVTRVQAEVHQELGKGIGLLRNLERVPEPEPVRIPYGTNDLQYYLLGRHDHWQLPEFRHRHASSAETPHPFWSWTEGLEQTALDAPDARIVDAETEELLVRRSLSLPASEPEADPPEETPDATSEQRRKTYRLSDAEVVQFIAAYQACGNRDKALTTLGRGTHYRQHANELIQVHGLRHKA